jgi:chromosomal replication initiation ATPase DnaA
VLELVSANDQAVGQQLAFDLPHEASTTRADFIVSESNRAAYTLINHTSVWPGKKLLIVGPASSGKTHLTQIWEQDHNAVRLEQADLKKDIVALASQYKHFILDDVDACQDEEALFHLYNAVHAQQGCILFTAQRFVRDWTFTTPDLVSRMQTVPMALLEEPDDELLYQLLRKLFSDRQLNVSDSVIDFLIRRIERRFSIAKETVARLDQVALQTGRSLNRTLVQQEFAKDAAT